MLEKLLLGAVKEELVQKKDAISFVWARFGFSRHNAEQKKAKCKCRQKIVMALRGNMQVE